MEIGIERPEELKGVGEAVKARVEQVAAIERASHQAALQGLDVDQPRVGIEGKVDSRVGRYEADYGGESDWNRKPG